MFLAFQMVLLRGLNPGNQVFSKSLRISFSESVGGRRGGGRLPFSTTKITLLSNRTTSESLCKLFKIKGGQDCKIR